MRKMAAPGIELGSRGYELECLPLSDGPRAVHTINTLFLNNNVSPADSCTNYLKVSPCSKIGRDPVAEQLQWHSGGIGGLRGSCWG